MEGINLGAVFKKKKIKRKVPLFSVNKGNRAVRNREWKFVSAYANARR